MLSDGSVQSLRTTNHILKRLGDSTDALAGCVRQICVGYTSKEATLPEAALVKVMHNIRTLEALVWRTWLQSSDGLLQSFHEAHPRARLEVIALKRNDMPLDLCLLASPKLHSLDIKLSILYDNSSDRWRRHHRGKSELGRLKSIILRSTNLKVLRIQIEDVMHGSRAARRQLHGFGLSEVDPNIFTFDEKETLPALEELAIPDLFKRVDRRNTGWADPRDPCEGWQKHINWSIMRTLDLRRTKAADVLVCLAGSLPHLQTLKIPSVPDADLYLFLQSASQLAHLHVVSGSSHLASFLDCMYATVGSQLLSLYVKVEFGVAALNREDFQRIFTHCTRLQALGVDDKERQVFGVWTPFEVDLLPDLKLKRLIRTTREYVSAKRFASRHSKRSWYKANAYIQYPGAYYLSTYYFPAPLEKLGHEAFGTKKWTKKSIVKMKELLERFGLAATALQED